MKNHGNGFKDMTGQKFNLVTFIKFAGTVTRQSGNKYALWSCRCDCGNTFIAVGSEIRGGHTSSCGCLARKGNHRTHELSDTSEYNIWANMIQRCNNPKNTAYPRYGGRGIKVCAEWNESFEAWFRDMGPRPSPEHSLDRFPNNDGNYEPGNVRWTSRNRQSRNKRNTRLITFKGETLSRSDWAERIGIPAQTLRMRLDTLKWTIEKALTESVHS